MTYKIFKYTIDPVTRIARMPHGRILRVDHVDDGFYPKGDYVWAIVDADDKDFFECPFPVGNWSAAPSPTITRNHEFYELKVKEKQTLELYQQPIFAQEDDGKLFVWTNPVSLEDKPKEYKIAVYKTGQKIDIDPDKLTYIGLCRLWIVQELGLYTFLVNE